jgi:acyl carrier protein
MEQVGEQIREYIVSEFGLDPDSIDRETLLFSSGILDSFGMVDLLTFVEDVAGWKFRVVDVNLENLDSIDRILQFIERRNS